MFIGTAVPRRTNPSFSGGTLLKKRGGMPQEVKMSHLLTQPQIEEFYEEFPWLKTLVTEQGFQVFSCERITAIRIQRVDEELLSRKPKWFYHAFDFGGDELYERLFVLDPQGQPMSQVGMVPHLPPRRWWQRHSKWQIRFDKDETVSSALKRIGEGAAARAKYVVSFNPTYCCEGVTNDWDALAMEVVISKF